MLNERGGVEAEVTLLHVAPDKFVMISGSAFGVRNSNWVRRQLPKDSPIALTDVTSGWAVLNICGPGSREVLQSVSDDDLSNAAFPYLAVRDIEVGPVPVRAVRVGYVGELGYELHVPTECAAMLYETLKRAGEPGGIRDVGYRAIETCRLEKGYVYWSAEIGPDYDPLSAGLEWAVDLGKDFIGRSALLDVQQERSDPPGMPFHHRRLYALAWRRNGPERRQGRRPNGKLWLWAYRGQDDRFRVATFRHRRRDGSSTSKRTGRVIPQRKGPGPSTIRKTRVCCRKRRGP